MKTYKIVYTETLVYTFYVEAENEEEAKEIFETNVAYGEFDFSDGAMSDTKFEIKEGE